MTYTYGNNADGTNMGTVSANNASDAIKLAVKLVGDKTEGRVRFYKSNPMRDAAITCISAPNCNRYDLIVRKQEVA